MARLIGVGTLLLLGPTPLPPAAASQAQDLRFERISIEDGLSQSSLTALMQDRLGFLWIGTDDGLNRYDGYVFETLRSSPSVGNSLSNNRIRSLLEDRDGLLWIGTRNGGLNRYDRQTQTFTHYRHDPEDPESLASDLVWALLQDRRGTIWVGTGNGLDRFDPDNPGTFSHLKHDPADPTSLGDDFVRTLFEDRAGNLWVGTQRGLNRVDAETGELTRYMPEPERGRNGYNSVGKIVEDQRGRLWLGTWSGLMRIDPQASTPSFDLFGARSGQPLEMADSIRDIYLHDDGMLWLAGNWNGLLIFDPGRESLVARLRHRPLDPHSLSGDQVKVFLADRSGAFWVGTSGSGLNKLATPTKAFAHYRRAPTGGGLADNMVTAIHEDRQGTLWVGSRNGGLDLVRRGEDGSVRITTDPSGDGRLPAVLVDGDVRAILEDSRGSLWVGTEARGLYRLQAGTVTEWHPDPADPSSLQDRDVWVLFEDRAGTLWVGTYGGGLSRYDGESGGFHHYLSDDADPGSLSSDIVRAMHQGSNGVLWIGTGDGGLNRMDPGGGSPGPGGGGPFRHYRHDPEDPESLSSDEVLSILEDRAGTLWVGTHGGGLNRLVPAPGGGFEGASFRHYTEEHGLPSNVVYGLIEDDRGRIWMSTNRGLSRFDPHTRSFRNFDVSDGLQSLEFNSGAHFKSRRGELFFGGINGLNAFYPERIADNPYVPPVVLTSFERFNRPVDLGADHALISEVRLRHDDSVVSFTFAALSYIAQHKNRYAYRLAGFRDEWIDLGTRRDVTFTNLSPGHYTLEVRASNNDGVWNEEGLALRIVVEPPFWRTAWFLLPAALAVAGLLWGTYLLRTRSIRRQNRALEVEISQRRRAQRESAVKNVELEAKNAEMERFVYTVSHDLKSPLVTIKGFVGLLAKDAASGDVDRVQHDVGRIAQAADTMRQLLEDLLDLSRVGRLMNPPERVSLSEVAREAADLLAGRSAARGAAVEIDPAMPAVEGDRLRLEEIYRNLLENAVKFLGDQRRPRIEVGARHDTDRVLCWVRDNGIGIDKAYQEKVFGLFERLDQRVPGTGVGLALVRRIVEMHGGRAWIQSAGSGRGSTVYFTLPPAVGG